jgi:hypothetical protein
MCGCGRRTPLAEKSNVRRCMVRGEPRRFMHGHGNSAARPHYIVDPATGCWQWQLLTTRDGYGRMYRNKRGLCAHRVFYEQAKGPIPPGMQLDHLCRNRRCVNPDHLEVVTPTENTRRGTATKLTADDVTAIRASSEPNEVLAIRYGVTASNIGAVRHGRSWIDVALDDIEADRALNAIGLTQDPYEDQARGVKR